MRFSLVAVFGLFFVSAALADEISKTPSVSLAGEKLFLANVEGESSSVILNEYIRTNETFDNWKVLFAVRQVGFTTNVNEVVTSWRAYLAQLPSPGVRVREAEVSSPADRRFMLEVRPVGDAYLEIDQLRFIPSPDGKSVIYYQAAVRVDPKDQADLKQGVQKGTALATALETISVKVIGKMPAPSAGGSGSGSSTNQL